MSRDGAPPSPVLHNPLELPDPSARFQARWRAEARRLERAARRMADGDTDLYDDLRQEARIALWESDPAPGIADEGAWLRSCARARMRRFLRQWQHPGRGWPRAVHELPATPVAGSTITPETRRPHDPSRHDAHHAPAA